MYFGTVLCGCKACNGKNCGCDAYNNARCFTGNSIFASKKSWPSSASRGAHTEN